MARDQLQRASDVLREASEAAEGEVSERLRGQADQLANLATRERGPDHGRLDRHLNTLRELTEEAEGGIHDKIVEARDAVIEYRETVEGV